MNIFKYMTRPIISPKTSATEAEGLLTKNFGFGRLCSASVIVWSRLYNNGFLKYYTFIKASESQCQSSGTTSEVIKHTTLGVVPEEKDVEHLGKTI